MPNWHWKPAWLPVSYPHLVMQEGFISLAKGFSFPFQYPAHLSLEASPTIGNVSSSVVRGLQDFPSPGSRRAARQLPHPSHFQPEAGELEPCARAPLKNLPGPSLLRGRQRMDTRFCGSAVGCMRRDLSSVWNSWGLLGVTGQLTRGAGTCLGC